MHVLPVKGLSGPRSENVLMDLLAVYDVVVDKRQKLPVFIFHLVDPVLRRHVLNEQVGARHLAQRVTNADIGVRTQKLSAGVKLTLTTRLSCP